ncbi:hypothetical protein [Sporosarcina sp. FA9]|uniref:hypothetical protein n=1 Tax=Sporosarcina sp. FA9 TaxID=3413030 RepID=UPI003F65C38A
MMKRFLIAVLSIVLFATLLAWVSYTPSVQREPNVYYFGFLETSFFVVIYAGPVYFLAGIPLSVLIDKLIGKTKSNSRWTRYFVGLGLYSSIGAFVGFIFPILLTENIDWRGIISYSLYGCIAANFYYHVLLLVSKINEKYLIFN